MKITTYKEIPKEEPFVIVAMHISAYSYKHGKLAATDIDCGMPIKEQPTIIDIDHEVIS